MSSMSNGSGSGRSKIKLINLGILLVVLLAIHIEARSFADQRSTVYEIDRDAWAVQNSNLETLAAEKAAVDYAAEMGCKNVGDIIIVARCKFPKDPDDVDILEGKLKRATPKHTPRFGRK